MFDIQHYTTENARDPVQRWLDDLRDPRARERIATRLDRLAEGNFGDCIAVGGTIRELRIHYGPGYRVYFARAGKTVILLLCAGSKKTQRADIATAKKRLRDWKARHGKTRHNTAKS